MTNTILRDSSSILTQAAPVEQTRTAPSRDRKTTPPRARWFYAFASLVLLAVTFIGFSQFYLGGKAYPNRPLTPPIRGILIAHGLSMSAWMLLFVVQPMLVAFRGYRAHKLLGRIGSVLAIVIVVLGVWVSFAAARVASPEMRWYGMSAGQFIAVPLITVALFGAFVGVAIWQRRNPAVHKAMMLLATLATVSAPLGRMDSLNNLYVGTIIETLFSAFPMTLALGILLLGIKAAWERSVDRALTIGLAAMAVVYCVVTQIAMTAAWERAMNAMIGIG